MCTAAQSLGALIPSLPLSRTINTGQDWSILSVSHYKHTCSVSNESHLSVEVTAVAPRWSWCSVSANCGCLSVFQEFITKININKNNCKKSVTERNPFNQNCSKKNVYFTIKASLVLRSCSKFRSCVSVRCHSESPVNKPFKRAVSC